MAFHLVYNLEQEHKYGVFEIGMSKKGEIGNLSKLVKPNIAIITNNRAHAKEILEYKSHR